MIKGVMTQIRRKDEEEDTDEETESVTSSSQVSAHRGQPLIWGNDKRNLRTMEGVLQKTQMILPRKGMSGMAIEDQEDIEVREVGLDHLEEMEQWDQWDPLDLGDSREGMDYPPLGVHLLLQG